MRTARVVIHQRDILWNALQDNRVRQKPRARAGAPKPGDAGARMRKTWDVRRFLEDQAVGARFIANSNRRNRKQTGDAVESVGMSRGGNEVLATDTGDDAEKKGTTEDAKDRDECVDDAQRSGSGAAMNDLGRSPCAIAGSDEPLLVWPSWSLDKPSGDVNLTGSDGLDESAFTPNLQRISLQKNAQGRGKLRSKLARTSRCARITLAAS